MPGRLNLARRPFVDARPPNLTAIGLGIAALVLSVVSVRTVLRYLDDSARTRTAITSLRGEIDRLEAERREREAAVARVDVAALSESARNVNDIAKTGAFSWTRFLSRLEETLPAGVRVTRIAVNDVAPDPTGRTEEGLYDVQLALVSSDPDGLPAVIRAFYRSPFDRPTPQSETSPSRGPSDGRQLILSVRYHDLPGSGK